MSGWVGTPVLEVSTREVGVVARDDNWGRGRTLTARFGGREEDFTLWNVGLTPKQDYAWLSESGAAPEWANFGDHIFDYIPATTEELAVVERMKSGKPKSPKQGELRVWWVRNPPCGRMTAEKHEGGRTIISSDNGAEMEHVSVRSVTEAVRVLDGLAKADLKRREVRENASGLEVYEGGEWGEFSDNEGRDIREISETSGRHAPARVFRTQVRRRASSPAGKRRWRR